MGINTYIKSFKKNNESINNHLESLNFYDINDTDGNRYVTNEIVVNNFPLIDTIIGERLFRDIFDSTEIYIGILDLLFYVCAPSPISGIGYSKDGKSILGFSPNDILPTIGALIMIAERWHLVGYNSTIDIEEEKNKLIEFENFLTAASNNDEVVTLVIG